MSLFVMIDLPAVACVGDEGNGLRGPSYEMVGYVASLLGFWRMGFDDDGPETTSVIEDNFIQCHPHCSLTILLCCPGVYFVIEVTGEVGLKLHLLVY